MALLPRHRKVPHWKLRRCSGHDRSICGNGGASAGAPEARGPRCHADPPPERRRRGEDSPVDGNKMTPSTLMRATVPLYVPSRPASATRGGQHTGCRRSVLWALAPGRWAEIPGHLLTWPSLRLSGSARRRWRTASWPFTRVFGRESLGGGGWASAAASLLDGWEKGTDFRFLGTKSMFKTA